ncbi:uncharacterized protein LOC132283152 [Cornus florida]|uniref:uncharacterized protein LOC132283152 n=1 Tax=Cornus florida TaxID=4283 RepID=UPI00289D99CE|nr:uncharacterized protein LOC132283152 [Cornus florida]XP_059641049.1 uncharacterized protein LOC132283152 [Cornus florida]XP_059641050.1 uncharacterized protein LOC132283152 [Cornus florida]XP_059641051.1 uncharacterized protein LOC132283152 [Cornus florida]
MESEQNVNGSRAEDSFVMDLDQRELARSDEDIMARRIKNRERQRRYRARKRLEADMKKASVINQKPPPQVELQVNGIVNNCITRIYCQRNWKKDARKIHAVKEVVSIGPLISDLTSGSESQASSLPSGANPERPLGNGFCSNKSPILDSSGSERNASGRRHWKAEARNKKN